MLVWRVDSTIPMLWEHNAVNVTSRTCFRLVRACGTQGNALIGVEDVDFDVFPGTRHVVTLTNETSLSNFLSFDQIAAPVVIDEIEENDRVISFRVLADENADSFPINYDLQEKYVVEAEQLVGEEWKPVRWIMATVSVTGTNGQTKQVFRNLIPGVNSETDNTSVAILVTDAKKKITVDAQRVALSSENSTWLCNYSDVDQMGAGVFSMKVNRHGIPVVNGDDVQIGFCTLPKTAYLVSNKKIISRLSSFRNLTFKKFDGNDDVTVIRDIPANEDESDVIHNLLGQRVGSAKIGVYIQGGKKFVVK